MTEETKNKLQRVMSLICAALFIVATALGIPVSDSLLNVGQGRGGSLDISDECEEEVKDIPVFGDVSDSCKKEIKNLHRKIHHIEDLCNGEEENNARDTN